MKHSFFRPIYLIAVISAGITILIGCAYYNSYYNAKKSYNNALKIIEKSNSTSVPGNAVTAFNIAIAKASRVLELYPNSRWADDAVLIIGKSYYFMGQIGDAKLKFQELILNFPYSKLVPEARSLHVKTLIDEGKLEPAEYELNEIIAAEDVKTELKSDAFLSLANLRFQRGDYESAIELSRQLVSESKSNELKSNAQNMIAESYFMLENYEQAASEYRKVNDYDPPFSILYNSRFKLGKSLELSGNYDRAIEEYSLILYDGEYKDRYTDVMLEIAGLWESKGELEQSIYVLEQLNILNPDSITQDQFDYIAQLAPLPLQEQIEIPDSLLTADGPIKDLPKVPEALFSIGEIYVYHYFDLVLARQYYASALNAQPDQNIKPKIDNRIKHIDEIDVLHQKISKPLPDFPYKKPKTADYIIIPKPDSISAFVDSVLNSTEPKVDTLTVNDSLSLSGIDEDNIEDSLIEMIDSSETVAFVMPDDSLIVPAAVFTEYDTAFFEETLNTYTRDYVIYRNRISQLKNEKAANVFRIAEIYNTEFGMIDSTDKYLTILINKYPESDDAAKALFSLYNIADDTKTAKRDSIKTNLFNNYRHTQYARYFMSEDKQSEIDGAPYLSQEDSIQALYDEAEKLYNRRYYYASIGVYKELAEKYFYTDYAPKSLYAAAWIYENDLEEPLKAFELYEKLETDYSSSELATAVKVKLKEARNIKAEEAKAHELERLRDISRKAQQEKNRRDSLIIVSTMNTLTNPNTDVFFSLEPDSVAAQPGKILTGLDVSIPQMIFQSQETKILDLKILINTQGKATVINIFRDDINNKELIDSTFAAIRRSTYYPALGTNELPVQAWHFRRIIFPRY